METVKKYILTYKDNKNIEHEMNIYAHNKANAMHILFKFKLYSGFNNAIISRARYYQADNKYQIDDIEKIQIHTIRNIFLSKMGL